MVKDEIFSARDRLSGALQFAVDEVKTRSPLKKQGESNSVTSSPVRSARNSPSQRSLLSQQAAANRKRKRKPLQRDLAFHHTYVMKLFDRSVDLAQFKEDTSLYPICRAWMKNQPRNKEMLPRIRTPTPEPPEDKEEDAASAKGLEGTFLEEVEDRKPPLGGEEKPPKEKKDKLIYKMPVFEPLKNDVHSKDFVSPRIPEPLEMERDETFDINKFQDEDSPSSAILLGDHMVRWCQVRRRWKESAWRNESRFNESNRLLQSMFN